MPYIGSIDQGTSSTRFLIFDSDTGKVVASSQTEVTHITPKSGWLELDPEEIYQTVVSTIKTVLSENPDIRPISSIGITNQRESTILWDKTTKKALHNAIIWCDARTQETVKKINQENSENPRYNSEYADFETYIKRTTGLPVSTYFSATKARWMLDNIESVKSCNSAGNCMFGTIDTWLMYKLSNGKVHATDATNASRTLLYDINTNQWSGDLVKLFKVEGLKLPEVKPSSCDEFCKIEDEQLEGVIGVKITGVLGDQQAALVGQKCLTSGELKNTYGTGCFLLQNTGTERIFSKNGLLTTVGYQKQNGEFVYAIEGSIGVAGLLIRWLRDQLEFFKDAREVETMAKTVEDSGGVYIVPAFSGLFCPYWASDARGVICGLTQFSNKNHIARAALEAVAWQVQHSMISNSLLPRDIVDAMKSDGQPCAVLKADGGMTVNKTLMQIQSDILQIPVLVPEMAESTALGAAVAAGMAIDCWDAPGWEMFKDFEGEKKIESTGEGTESGEFTRYEPKTDMDGAFKKWKKAVQRSVGWEDI